MKEKDLILFWLSFCSLFNVWKILPSESSRCLEDSSKWVFQVFGRFFQVSLPGVWKILPNTKQAAKTQPKQVFFFHFSSFLTVYLLLKCHFQEHFGLRFSNWQIRRTLVCISAVADSAKLWSVFQQLTVQENFGLRFSNWWFRRTVVLSGELWSFQENFGLCFSSWRFRGTLVCVSAINDSGELWSVFQHLMIQENFGLCFSNWRFRRTPRARTEWSTNWAVKCHVLSSLATTAFLPTTSPSCFTMVSCLNWRELWAFICSL